MIQAPSNASALVYSFRQALESGAQIAGIHTSAEMIVELAEAMTANIVFYAAEGAETEDQAAKLLEEHFDQWKYDPKVSRSRLESAKAESIEMFSFCLETHDP